MKFTLAFCITLALVAGYHSSVIPSEDSAATYSSNIDIGEVGAGDTVLYTTHFIRPAIPGVIQEEVLPFTGSQSTVITAIRVVETYPQGASVAILSGGLNSNNVQFNFKSQRGSPVFYYVAIIGRWA